MKDNEIISEKERQKNVFIEWEKYFESELSQNLNNLNKYLYCILINSKSLEKLKHYFFSKNINEIKNFYNNFYNNFEFIYSLQLSNIEKIEEFPSIFILNEETWNSMIPNNNSIIIEKYRGDFGNHILLFEIQNHNNYNNKIYGFFFLFKKNIIRQGFIKIKQLSKEKEIINSLKANGPLNFMRNNNIKINENKSLKNSFDFDIVILELTINKKNNGKYLEKPYKGEIQKVTNNLTNVKIIKEKENNNIIKEFQQKKGNTINNEKNPFIKENDLVSKYKLLSKNKNQMLQQNSKKKQNLELKIKNKREIERDFRPKKIIIIKEKRDFSPLLLRKKAFKLNIDNMNLDEFLPKKAIHKESTPGIIGLFKNGDICYMNATIQCFSNIKSLRIELLNQNTFQDLEKNKNDKKLSYALAFEFKNLWKIIIIELMLQIILKK